MTAKQLFDAGKVREAQQALTAHLREHPTDVAQRTFLFELLCFSGDYARAEKHLAVLAQGNAETELGAVLYYSVLHGEKTRHEVFEKQQFSHGELASPSGQLNGRPFQSLRDADPDIGARLEVFAAGAYLWIPFEHIASLEMQPPRRLRDTLWAPALIRTGPSFKGTETRGSAYPGDLSLFLERSRRSGLARASYQLGSRRARQRISVRRENLAIRWRGNSVPGSSLAGVFQCASGHSGRRLTWTPPHASASRSLKSHCR